MSPTEPADPVQRLAYTLAQCREFARRPVEQIALLEPRFHEMQPAVANRLAQTREVLQKLDGPDLTILLERLEADSDPTRWIWKQGR